MSWCKELVMAENRALFEIIDATTGQITEDRSIREKSFKYNFQGISSADSIEQNFPINSLNIRYLNLSEIFFEHSGFIDSPQYYVFNLIDIFEGDSFDSLFIYTNINEHNSIFLCKNLGKIKDEFFCQNSNDIMTSSHKEIVNKIIPPYFEGNHREASLKTVNIINMKELIQREKYSRLILKLPLFVKSKQKHQLIVKFDWYKISERSKVVDLPNIIEYSKSIEISSKTVFQRIHLPQLQHVLQAYTLTRLPKNGESCDDYFTKKVQSNEKPLSSSPSMIQFHEPLKTSPFDQTKSLKHNIYHSQAIQSKSKDLVLFLSANHNKETLEVPYIDLIQFDLRHLVRNTPSNLNELNNLKCSIDYDLKIVTNYFGILGQYIRFYILFVPCYIVIILQIYDSLILSGKISENEEKVGGDFFILNRSHTLFFSHLKYSLFITLGVFIFQTDFVRKFLANNSLVLQTDFEILNNHSIWLTFVPFLLYWNAYALLSAATFFLSFLFITFSFIIDKVLCLTFLKWNISQKLLSILHLTCTGFICFSSPSLAYCSIFYAEMIRLSVKNPKYSESKLSLSMYWLCQSRLVLFYLILVLNLPSLIVWAKSLESPVVTSFYAHYNPLAITVACVTTFIYFMFYLKDSFILFERIFSLNNGILARLITINCCMTLFYSTVSVYRLQYFILIHLFLTLLNSLAYDSKRKLKKE
jgi:hypothetical protein